MVLNITNGATTPKPNGVTFLDEYAGHIETLYETGARPLTTVGGTANVVTATMAVDLTTSGFVDGLCVSLVWAAANTAGVTLSINGGANVPVLDASGAALDPGALAAGLTSILRYTAGSWRIMSSLALDAAPAPSYYTAITASGTWTRPAGYADDRLVIIEAWGGGGGGASASTGGGGGGAAYVRREMRYADVPSSVSVTIGAGGAIGASGGDTTFGSLVTARAGRTTSGTGGAGGGGEVGAGSSTSSSTGGAGGTPNGGNGGAGNASGSGTSGQSSFWGGGGGGGSGSGTGNNGGAGGGSVFGGGGGGAPAGVGGTAGVGGVSLFGGAGGANGVGGTVPGGGGGRGAAGARGEVRIRIV